jgi:hypothetical protein
MPEQRAEREKSTFLTKQDESGCHADFHALRHTFNTGLVTGGVNPKGGADVGAALGHHADDGPRHAPVPRQSRGGAGRASQPVPADKASPSRDRHRRRRRDNQRCALGAFLGAFRWRKRRKTAQHGLNAARVEDSTERTKDAENPGESRVLTDSGASAIVSEESRRGGRVVECAGFENRSARKGSGSSNLPLSA